MNKKVALTIGSAVVGGAVSKGITGMVDVSPTVKIVMSLALCAGAGYLASQVKGNDTKAVMLQGAYVGTAVAQGFEAIKAFGATPAITDRLDPTTKLGMFGRNALGLNAGVLNGGYFDNDGNYHEDGLGGYVTPSGNTVPYGQLNASENGLNGGYYDERGMFVSDGLNAVEMDFDGLNGGEDEYYDELNGYDEDEDGLGVIEMEYDEVG